MDTERLRKAIENMVVGDDDPTVVGPPATMEDFAKVDMGLYILDGKTPVHVDDPIKWASWFETANLKVKRSANAENRVGVSTIFLGVDYGHSAILGGKPLLFESMVFGGSMDQECRQCSTWEEAEAQHDWLCAEVAAVEGLKLE